MIRIGTLCYVVASCMASPATAKAVGKIVEVVSAPYDAPHDGYLPGTYYDVSFEGWTFYCRSDKLVAISDPGADVVREIADAMMAQLIALVAELRGEVPERPTGVPRTEALVADR